MSYLIPGVYVEEVSGGPRPIEGVGTSTAGFVGRAPDPNARVNAIVPVDNWQQFVNAYAPPGSASTHLAQAVFGFFSNGGRRCYCVNIGNSTSLRGDGRQQEGITLFEEVDDITIVAAPGFTSPMDYSNILEHVELCKDRFAILDTPLKISDFAMLKKVATVEVSDSGEESEGKGLLPQPSPRGFGALYFPWINIQDPLAPKNIIAAPPSGHLAGVYARVDALRGVHKAPANENIRGAVGVSHRITPQQQGELNPLGVNCIRLFARQGILIWGARTLASDPEWRYVNVRRLFTWIEKSIELGTNWVVFEPNTESLWKRLSADVENFLKMVWRQGALMGSSPQEAFFVQCDRETNPPEAVDAGQLCIRIGIAPVKPAEFVIFRISQSAAGSEVEIEGESEGG